MKIHLPYAINNSSFEDRNIIYCFGVLIFQNMYEKSLCQLKNNQYTALSYKVRAQSIRNEHGLEYLPCVPEK